MPGMVDLSRLPRPERTSFPVVLLGTVYVATPDPDGPGYLTRRYTPDDDPQ